MGMILYSLFITCAIPYTYDLNHLVNIMFKDLIGKLVEVYVNIKSRRVEDHAKDIAAVFDVLDKVGMKLNPEKSTFEIKTNKFLGYMVSKRGIKANPK